MGAFAHICSLNIPCPHAFFINYRDILVYHSLLLQPHKRISAYDQDTSPFSFHLRFESFFTELGVFMLFLYISSLFPFLSLKRGLMFASFLCAVKGLMSHPGLQVAVWSQLEPWRLPPPAHPSPQEWERNSLFRSWKARELFLGFVHFYICLHRDISSFLSGLTGCQFSELASYCFFPRHRGSF